MSYARELLPSPLDLAPDLLPALGGGLLPGSSDWMNPALGPVVGPMLGNDWMKGLLGGGKDADEAPEQTLDQLTPGARARLEASGGDLESFRSSVSGRALAAMTDEDGNLPRGFSESLAGASLTELAMLDDLGAAGLDQEGLGQVLRGGHVRVEDGGALYEQWADFLKDNPVAQERTSSHYKGTDSKQYGVRGSLFHEGLIGRTQDPGAEGSPETWLQLEGSPAYVNPGDPSSYLNLADPSKRKSTADHMVDFAKYKLTGRNQGPWGSSEHTEQNRPLVLDGHSTGVDESLHHDGLLTSGWNKVKGLAGGAWNLGTGLAGSALHKGGELAGEAWDKGGDLVGGAVHKGEDLAGKAKDKVGDVADGAWGGLKSAGGTVGGWF